MKSAHSIKAVGLDIDDVVLDYKGILPKILSVYLGRHVANIEELNSLYPPKNGYYHIPSEVLSISAVSEEFENLPFLPYSKQVLDRLWSIGLPLFAVSSCCYHPTAYATRCEQFKRNFKSVIVPDGINIEDIEPEDRKVIKYFQKEVIMGGKKSPYILEFLEANKLRPEEVVFVDDALNNIEELSMAVKGLNLFWLQDARFGPYTAKLPGVHIARDLRCLEKFIKSR
ncbi:MAG: DUF2608 domain-containing protein [Alphaproteobacteria bacterium]|nr:DUF2608 domain-containing protein [Alphaproteobacteria bacterium]